MKQMKYRVVHSLPEIPNSGQLREGSKFRCLLKRTNPVCRIESALGNWLSIDQSEHRLLD